MEKGLAGRQFSVLMPVYYRELPDHLERAVKSIQEQTVRPSEIMLAIDTPLDGELHKVVSDFISHDPELFKVVRVERNRGLGFVLAVGVKEAQHDIIARMDSDDVAMEDRFEKQLDVLEKNPEIDVVGSWVDEFEESTDHIVSRKRLPETTELIRKWAGFRCPMNHPSVMFRRPAVLSAGNYRTLGAQDGSVGSDGEPGAGPIRGDLMHEDYDLWIRMLSNGSEFYNIQESLLYFRVGRSTYSRRGGWSNLGQEILLQREMYQRGLISGLRMILNLTLRVTFRSLPIALRMGLFRRVRVVEDSMQKMGLFRGRDGTARR